MTVYSAYGVGIRSEVSFDGYLPSGPESAPPRFQLVPGRLGLNPAQLAEPVGELVLHGRLARCSTDRPFVEGVEPSAWMIEVEGALRFFWRVGEGEICFEYTGVADEQRLVFWFLHIVLPFRLTLEQHAAFLHASAVVVDARAVLFVAPTGTGKSTLARCFVDRGHALLSDDKLALRHSGGQYRAAPSHGRLRHYRAHEDLGEPVAQVADSPSPVAAVFALSRNDGIMTSSAQALTGARAFQVFHRHTLYAFTLPAETALHQAARLASRIPAFSFQLPDDRKALSGVYDSICRLARKTAP